MSNELRYIDQSGLTVAATVIAVSTGDSTLVSVPEVESGWYVADFPAVSAGTYDILFISGGNVVGVDTIIWDGADAVSADNEILTAIESKTELIGTLSVATSSPIAADGTISVHPGDDYLFVDGREIPFTISGPFPSLLGGSVLLVVMKTAGRRQIFTAAGTITSGVSCYVEIPKAQSALLRHEIGYVYELQTTLANGDVATPQVGEVTII